MFSSQGLIGPKRPSETQETFNMFLLETSIKAQPVADSTYYYQVCQKLPELLVKKKTITDHSYNVMMNDLTANRHNVCWYFNKVSSSDVVYGER